MGLSVTWVQKFITKPVIYLQNSYKKNEKTIKLTTEKELKARSGSSQHFGGWGMRADEGHGQHKLQSETLSQTKHKKKLKILYFFLHITILDTIS